MIASITHLTIVTSFNINFKATKILQNDEIQSDGISAFKRGRYKVANVFIL